MSPKSHGRLKGRGRPIHKQHLASVRPLTLHEQVILEAVYLGHDAPRMTAETVASQWLGEAWASAGMGQRHAERDLVEALMVTDLYWPRQTDPGCTEFRALAHSRSRSFAVRPDRQPISDDERHDLIDSFVAENDGVVPKDVLRALADTFIDFGDGYQLGGVLAWSPGEVERFVTDWVLRKVILEADEREALPEVLRSWLAFALRRRGLQERDIAPVVDAVDELEDEFREAFDDWGPGRQVTTALLERGVDLSDKDAVADAIRVYNAEQMARQLEGSQE